MTRTELEKKLKYLDLEFLAGVPVHLSPQMVEEIMAVFDSFLEDLEIQHTKEIEDLSK